MAKRTWASIPVPKTIQSEYLLWDFPVLDSKARDLSRGSHKPLAGVYCGVAYFYNTNVRGFVLIERVDQMFSANSVEAWNR